MFSPKYLFIYPDWKLDSILYLQIRAQARGCPMGMSFDEALAVTARAEMASEQVVISSNPIIRYSSTVII